MEKPIKGLLYFDIEFQSVIIMIILALLHLISISFLACKHIGDSAASLSVTIRIDSFAHSFISCRIIEECADFIHNLVIISAYKMYSPAGESLWSFSGVAHYEYRLTKAWSLFLYAA